MHRFHNIKLSQTIVREQKQINERTNVKLNAAFATAGNKTEETINLVCNIYAESG